MKSRMFFFVAFITLAMVAASPAQQGRGGNNGRHGNGGYENRSGNLLTDDQKQELHELISSMRQDGATRDDIYQAVDALFAEWGVEAPEWRKGQMSGHRGVGDPQLTDEQRDELRTTIAEMRQAGATREDIHAAVEALYAEWGLEMPEPKGPWSELLTDEQQAELKALLQEMKDAGATRREIRAAVDALFEEWGIERPDGQGRKDGKGKNGNRGWMGDLSEEQRTTIRELIQEMRADGATREEIRQAVNALLEEWGIDGDENDPDGAQLRREQKNIQATNAPNPFNPTTTITYSLEEASPVSVHIYNAHGQLIRTLIDSNVSEGQHSITWNGLNDRGEQVSSGMYFYKVTSANETVTERMMLMK